MIDANVKDLPVADYESILSKLNSRFLTNLSNEEARKRFSEIIDESMDGTLVEVAEFAHRLAVMMKWQSTITYTSL